MNKCTNGPMDQWTNGPKDISPASFDINCIDDDVIYEQPLT